MAPLETKGPLDIPDASSSDISIDLGLYIVSPGHRKQYVCFFLPVKAESTGEEIMLLLRRKLSEVNPRRCRCLGRLGSILAMRSMALEKATVSPLHGPVAEEQLELHPVFLRTHKISVMLTDAFEDPSALQGTANFAELHLKFCIRRDHPHQLAQHGALLISDRLNLTALCIWFFISFMLSIGIGLVTGVMLHTFSKFNCGLAIGSSVLAVLMGVQGLLIRLYS
ncbi:hypothetical protein K490DRAFT_64167 [Saccharata proteae CBS 121410]|uniref:Uncharacterized protein n=1 Tax=Saccharata proteae CBS 121410 TaxID=1314787 RepID=A0A6A5YDN3_9PEZI|nr:hypothetical protein K490DRAFT_64167 [Saccharata proteae CBS 121410]